MAPEVWHDINEPSGLPSQEKNEEKSVAPEAEPEPEKEKSGPEFRISSATITVPAGGLKQEQPFDFECEIEPLIEKITKPRLLADAVTSYKDKEEFIDRRIEFYVDESGSCAKGTCKKLIFPNDFLSDRTKAPDAKFMLFLKISGEAAQKEFTSESIDLPTAAQEIILKKEKYDDTWADKTSEKEKYPKSGDNYIPGEKIKKLQENLWKFRLMDKERATGYFGDMTDKAVKEFQEYAKGTARKKADDIRVFRLEPDKVTYQGATSGEVDEKTEKEIAVWIQENYVKPEPEYRRGDYDKEGRYNNPDTEHDIKSDPHYYNSREIQDFQNMLRDVGAFSGRPSGFFCEATLDALKVFQGHAERGELVDSRGNTVVLKPEERLSEYREGVGCGKTIAAAKQAKAKGLKVAVQKQPGTKNVKDLCEKHLEAHKNDCSGFVKAVATELNVALEGQANDIVDKIQKSPWKVLKDGIEADSEARAGKFVVAGLKDEPNGHVVIIVPGELAHGKYPTGYWGRLNGAGEKNKTINFSFIAKDRDKVIYASIQL